jgi:deoxyribonuclease V
MEMQKNIAKKIVYEDYIIESSGCVCGVDVSYKEHNAHCAALILNQKHEIIETAYRKTSVKFPYTPGLFMLRESPPILDTVSALKHPFDVLFVNGHGVLHPRNCGLASYVGFILGKPTIGVAKKLLVGTIMSTGFVKYDGKLLGYRIHRPDAKDIFVSIGYFVSLVTAIAITRKFTKVGEYLPEPLRLADIHSKSIPPEYPHYIY